MEIIFSIDKPFTCAVFYIVELTIEIMFSMVNPFTCTVFYRYDINTRYIFVELTIEIIISIDKPSACTAFNTQFSIHATSTTHLHVIFFTKHSN